MFKHFKQGAVDVVTAESPVTGSSLDLLHNTVNPLLANCQPRIVLDLSNAPLIDSAGLETLLDLHESAQDLGGQLCLAAPNPLVEELLVVSETASIVEVFPSTSAAVGSFAK